MNTRIRAGRARAVAFKHPAFVAVLLFVPSLCQASAQGGAPGDVRFVNVVDSSLGFSGLSRFPAINNRGAVAFVASRPVGGQGVFKWAAGNTTRVASSVRLSNFGDDVVINDKDVVGYEANSTNGANDRAIFASNGSSTRLIVDANQQGFLGRFLGSPSINASGSVAFFALRKDSSQAVFVGDGGELKLVADTVDARFTGFGNSAINDFGQITFPATRQDGSQGVFITGGAEVREAGEVRFVPCSTITAVTDPNNPLFTDPFASFGDPVINDKGTIADVGFLSSGSLEIFTGNVRRVSARSDPESSFFTQSEHPSINNKGAVAFFANELGGGQGIFVEETGGASPVAVIKAGDAFFGSVITGLDLGRFALNDYGQLAFHYDLEDGRSGIAILSTRQREEQ